MKQYYKILIVAIIFVSCKKEIKINLNDVAQQIVIEGVITNLPGPYQVLITKTVNYSDANNFPPVTGASVIIADKTVFITDTLSEASAGRYITHLIKGIPGHRYDLTINTAGQIYTASSTMPLAVTLDSISFTQISGFGSTTINTIPNFQDPMNIANYYTFDVIVNSRKLQNIFVFDDRLSDGKYIRQQLFADSNYIKVGDTVKVNMNCVDKNVWSYFNVLELTAVNNGVPYLAPANPTSNISNNALGYFSAQAIQTKVRVVPKF